MPEGAHLQRKQFAAKEFKANSSLVIYSNLPPRKLPNNNPPTRKAPNNRYSPVDASGHSDVPETRLMPLTTKKKI